jgi:predicted RNase H-related nuclease YkuK (DUF458 family)
MAETDLSPKEEKTDSWSYENKAVTRIMNLRERNYQEVGVSYMMSSFIICIGCDSMDWIQVTQDRDH